MKKRGIVLLILGVVGTVAARKEHKNHKKEAKVTDYHVIGHHRGAGFFSMYLGALNNISWAERNGKKPVIYWGDRNLYYDKNYKKHSNVWEYYFAPIGTDELSKSPKHIHNDYFDPRGGYRFCVTYDPAREHIDRRWAYDLISRYIKPKKHIVQKVNAFYDKHFRGHFVIGIHLRGTDKGSEVTPVDPYKILRCALAIAAQHKNVRFFIATDEERLLKIAKEVLGNAVIAYDSHRSPNGLPIHSGVQRLASPYLLGEEMLVEGILLSRCNFFMHTFSNVSIAVLCMNPDLQHQLFVA